MSAPAANMPKFALRSLGHQAVEADRDGLRSSVRSGRCSAMMNSLIEPMKASRPVMARIGVISGRMMPKKICDVGGAVDLRRLVQILRDGVEEPLHQPGVAAERATEAQDDQRPRGVEPDRRVEIGDRREHQVERRRSPGTAGNIWISRMASRPAAATLEPEPGERERGAGRDEHRRHRGQHADDHRVEQPAPEVGVARTALVKLSRLAPVGIRLDELQRAQRVQRRGDHEQDREDREEDGDERRPDAANRPA